MAIQLEAVVNRDAVDVDPFALTPEDLAATHGLPPGSSLMDISQIRVGMRVAARNPEVNEQERLGFHDPDQATWRFLYHGL